MHLLKNILIVIILQFGVYAQAQTVNSHNVLLAKLAYNTSETKVFNDYSQMFVTPASLLKVVTTATALEVLGPDYTFKTRIGYNGVIKNGILYGDIVVIAGNDPTLGSQYFDETGTSMLFKNIESILLQNNIQSVAGGIQVQQLNEDVAYPGSRLWEDMGNYYGGIPHVLNYRDNTIEITLKSREIGTTCEIIQAKPDNVAYQFESKVLAASHKKDSAYVYGIKNIYHWWIEGSIPANKNAFKIKAAMPDPSVYFVDDLKDYLQLNGIDFATTNEQVNVEDTGFNLLYEIESPPLSQIIEVTNHESNNLFADQLFLALGEYYFGNLSWDNGVKALNQFWEGKIDFSNNFSLKDGSGLSPKNKVTAKGMVSVLDWMKKNSQHFEVFQESLAIGGMSGTLKYTFMNPAIQGKIFGKSGSMEGVLGYCGYYQSSSGLMPFCIVANNYIIPTKQVRNYIDKYLTDKFLQIK